LDLAHSSGVTNPLIISGDIKLLSHSATVVYAVNDVYIFRLRAPVKGVVGS
jgi:hypothetical protein